MLRLLRVVRLPGSTLLELLIDPRELLLLERDTDWVDIEETISTEQS